MPAPVIHALQLDAAIRQCLFVDLENHDTDTLAPGMPIARDATGGIVRAASTMPGLQAFGVIQRGSAPTFACRVQFAGELTLDDWTDLIGASALTLGVYFLDESPGRLTALPPTTNYLQSIGLAITPHTLVVRVAAPIRL